MRNVRVFIPIELSAGARVVLPEQAAQHIIKVLRLRLGAALTLFNGQGGEYGGKLIEIHRKIVSVEVGTFSPVKRESTLHITLLQGLARGERMDFIIQKATELGVARIIPVQTERSVVQLDDTRVEKRSEHWRNVATAACEQCGRNILPNINAPLNLFFACKATLMAQQRWLLTPEATQSLIETATALATDLSSIAILIGPEGGLSDAEEIIAQSSGFRPMQFGARIMRTETAAIAALAALQSLAGDLG